MLTETVDIYTALGQGRIYIYCFHQHKNWEKKEKQFGKCQGRIYIYCFHQHKNWEKKEKQFGKCQGRIYIYCFHQHKNWEKKTIWEMRGPYIYISTVYINIKTEKEKKNNLGNVRAVYISTVSINIITEKKKEKQFGKCLFLFTVEIWHAFKMYSKLFINTRPSKQYLNTIQILEFIFVMNTECTSWILKKM